MLITSFLCYLLPTSNDVLQSPKLSVTIHVFARISKNRELHSTVNTSLDDRQCLALFLYHTEEMTLHKVFESELWRDPIRAASECSELKAHANAKEGIYQLSSDSATNRSYLFRNLKHRLCLVSEILGSLASCFDGGLVRESFSIAFMNLRRCWMYSG